MQRLRQPADVVEGGLSHLANLAQVGPHRRVRRRLLRHSSQHRAHRRQQLAELVVQFARQLAQRGLARGDESARQVLARVGQRGQLAEETPVRSDQQQAGGDDGPERRRQEPVGLALHPVVDRLRLPRGLFLPLVVLDQQPRHRGADRRLPRLQRQLHLRARLRFLALPGEREDAIGRVPELLHRAGQILALLRRLIGHRRGPLARQRIVQIAADALELRRPRGQRIPGFGIQHVAHRQPQLVQIVLDPQQLQRFTPVAIRQFGLQPAQSLDLPETYHE